MRRSADDVTVPPDLREPNTKRGKPMKSLPQIPSSPRRKRPPLAAAVLGALVLGPLALFALPSAAQAQIPGVEITPLARGPFTDEVSGLLLLRLQGDHRTQPIQLADASEVVLLKLVIHPGYGLAWHIHPGPVTVSVAEGSLKVTQAHDCSARTYRKGQSFIEAPYVVHRADNVGQEDVVIYGTFLGIPAGSPPTIFSTADPGC
jgi:quercetin dioxygenase-like cupin family protein